MKDRHEIKNDTRAVFFAVMFAQFREKALDLGYTLALHGTMANDMDLLAVPWVEDAKSPEELVSAMIDCLGGTIWGEYVFKECAVRPHGRIVYTLPIMGDIYIDLSIMKRHEKT